ncbi:MAG: hypothetical protein ACRC41_17300 [Sarcina sp.]
MINVTAVEKINKKRERKIICGALICFLILDILAVKSGEIFITSSVILFTVICIYRGFIKLKRNYMNPIKAITIKKEGICYFSYDDKLEKCLPWELLEGVKPIVRESKKIGGTKKSLLAIKIKGENEKSESHIDFVDLGKTNYTEKQISEIIESNFRSLKREIKIIDI